MTNIELFNLWIVINVLMLVAFALFRLSILRINNLFLVVAFVVIFFPAILSMLLLVAIFGGQITFRERDEDYKEDSEN